MEIRASVNDEGRFFYAEDNEWKSIVSRCGSVGDVFHGEKIGLNKYEINHKASELRGFVRELDYMIRNGYYDPKTWDSINGLRGIVLYSMSRKKNIFVERSD